VITSTKSSTKSTTKQTVTSKTITQTPISGFLLDSFIVGNIKKNERATATAAKKKIKEQMKS